MIQSTVPSTLLDHGRGLAEHVANHAVHREVAARVGGEERLRLDQRLHGRLELEDRVVDEAGRRQAAALLREVGLQVEAGVHWLEGPRVVAA